MIPGLAQPNMGSAGSGHELVLGGARSGKSAWAEQRAAAWLAADPLHDAVLLATALAGDADMAERIARHRQDRAVRVPGLQTLETPLDLAEALRATGHPNRLLVVDCLTLWLTQVLMPPPVAAPAEPAPAPEPSPANSLDPGLDPAALAAWAAAEHALLAALADSRSPVVLVSNEIGLGVMPLSRAARACVDAQGRLHQRVAQRCARVTLMVAGCPLAVKA